MYFIILQMFVQLCFNNVFVIANDELNNPLFNLDHTMLEKTIAAVFNKVAHSSVTTKRSVPTFEIQLPSETTAATLPLPTMTSSSENYNSYTPRPIEQTFPGLPPQSSSRSLFTPPLPPEYANPFADKPTLRGANDFKNPRLPGEDGPTLVDKFPPKLAETVKSNFHPTENTSEISKDQSYFLNKQSKTPNKSKNQSSESVPTLHISSISRILSGSNGKKQDVPEILFKPIKTDERLYNVSSVQISKADKTTVSSEISFNINPSSFSLPNAEVSKNTTVPKQRPADEIDQLTDRNKSQVDEKVLGRENFELSSMKPTVPSVNNFSSDGKKLNQTLKPLVSKLGYAWRIAWLLHIYLAATLFTFLALYSLFKIIKLSRVYSNQTYFLGIYLLLTLISILRCFYLLYDAYNFSSSLPESISNLLMFLPSGFLCCAFSMLFSFLSYNTSSTVINKKNLPLKVLILSYIINIVCVIILLISFDVLNLNINVSTLLCQCIYVIMFLFIGFIYIYTQYASKMYLNNFNIQAICDRVHPRSTVSNFNSTLNACNAVALLFILMGLIKFYGILFIINTLKTYTWLWYGWQSSVRLLELSICGLLVYSCILSKQYSSEKDLESKYCSRFAKFSCENSISTETTKNLNSRTICCTADSNFVNRSERHAYNDNFPLNTFKNSNKTLNLREAQTSKRFHRKIQFNHGSESLGDVREIQNRNLVAHNHVNEMFHPHKNLIACPSTSGSNMLVAENGFVRFKNIEKNDKELPNSYKPIKLYDNSDQNCSLLDLGTNHKNQFKIYNT